MKKRFFYVMLFLWLIVQLCFSQAKVLFLTADNQWAKLESHNEGMNEYLSNAFALPAFIIMIPMWVLAAHHHKSINAISESDGNRMSCAVRIKI